MGLTARAPVSWAWDDEAGRKKLLRFQGQANPPLSLLNTPGVLALGMTRSQSLCPKALVHELNLTGAIDKTCTAPLDTQRREPLYTMRGRG